MGSGIVCLYINVFMMLVMREKLCIPQSNIAFCQRQNILIKNIYPNENQTYDHRVQNQTLFKDITVVLAQYRILCNINFLYKFFEYDSSCIKCIILLFIQICVIIYIYTVATLRANTIATNSGRKWKINYFNSNIFLLSVLGGIEFEAEKENSHK